MKWTELVPRYHLHHLLLWGILFFGWHFFRHQDYPADTAWWITFTKVADLALMVYVTNYFLIPKFLYRKRYVVFGILFILLVCTFSILKLHIEVRLFHWKNFNIWYRFKDRIYDNVIPHFLLVSTGAAIKLLVDHAHAQKEKAETELNFLRSQINPHLVFNSLNTIYFLIDKQNVEARQTLLQFSGLLRYQLYDCNNPTIEIEKEVRYLEDYIRLQKLRKDSQYEVGVTIGQEVKGFHITPLLLVPFVENAFKHLSHHLNERNFIQVALSCNNGTLRFMVENSKEEAQQRTEPPGGIGLGNVKRRLELLYPGKHRLQIINHPTTYTVELNIELP